jgi:leucyl aminopeptidase
MKCLLLLAFCLINFNFAGSNPAIQSPVWITVSDEAASALEKAFPQGLERTDSKLGLTLFTLESDFTGEIAAFFDRNSSLGKFMYHETLPEAKSHLLRFPIMTMRSRRLMPEMFIDKADTVQSLLPLLQEKEITDTIIRLSDFHTRYYNTKTGIEASEWLFNKWQQMSAASDSFSVSFFRHANTQPSVILTIKGSRIPQEHIVFGGHLDSTAGYGGGNRRAPGADDNASGVAIMTEMIRVLANSSYQPEKSVKFIAFAAEEVGLRGSKAIARDFREKSIEVNAMINLDMANYKGSPDVSFVFVNDFVNPALTDFLQQLNDTYLKLPWAVEKCGYACSDHASWHTQGYASAYPFECYEKDMSKTYHTDKDTIDISGGHSEHALNFARLGMAALVELAK